MDVVAGATQGVMAVAADERLAIQQAAHHRHAETTRAMVVASARGAKPRRPGAFP